MNRSIGDLFSELQSLDPSLKVVPKMLASLARRRILPQPYSRQQLFSCMVSGKAVLFDDYPSPVDDPGVSSIGKINRLIPPSRHTKIPTITVR